METILGCGKNVALDILELIFEALEPRQEVAIFALGACAITWPSLRALSRTISTDIVNESISIGTCETGCLVFVSRAVENPHACKIQ
jgi:hypothetical protein